MSAETQKVSRYRALRGKSVSESRRAIDEALNDSKQDEAKEPIPVLRRASFGSRVLKRRSRTLGQIQAADIEDLTVHFPVPPVPQVSLSPKEHDITSPLQAATEPSSPIFGATGQRLRESSRPQSARAPLPPPFTFPVATAVTTDAAVDGGCDTDWERRDLEVQKRRLEEEEAVRLADRLEAETDRILAEQKKLDLARLHQQLLATQSAVSLAHTPTKPKSPVLEKLNFFNRGRSSKAATLSPTSSTSASLDFSRAQSLDPTLSPRQFYDPAGHCMLMTPPLSPNSVNQSHERVSDMFVDFGASFTNTALCQSVIVRCRGSSVYLTVVADTSTVDILFQASDSVMHSINTAASVVYECYAQLGLERRLRRYERIRDVLNSWDRDTQNSLLILPSCSADSDKDLDISSVPPTLAPAAGFTLQLHHSSRPGKWNKRWITLSDDGQILSSKKAGPRFSSRDTQCLCHLSDYDIYTLMCKSTSAADDAGAKSAGYVVKNLKPPKKFVYAIKSQRKTVAHADTANFVHFFCTDDPTVANRFHASVHAWRSWYMVKARREAQRKRLMDAEKDRPPQIMSIKHKLMKSVSHVKVPGQGHRIRVSIDETPYTIGEFQPLVDLQRFDKPIDEFGKDWIPDPRLSAVIPPDSAAAPPAPAPVPAPASAPASNAASTGLMTPAVTPTVEEAVMTGLWGMSAEAQDRRRLQAQRKASAAGEGGAAQRQTVDGSQQAATTSTSTTVTVSPLTVEANNSSDSTPAASPTKPKPLRESDSEASPSSPKPEPKSWLPSASEHTARVKAEQERLERLQCPPQKQRPSTSSGIANSQRHQHQYYQQQYSPPYGRGGGRQGGGGGGGSGKRGGNYPAGLGEMAGHVRAASQWTDLGAPSPSSFSPSSACRPRFLEVPTDARGLPSISPALPRKPSLPSASGRPSTSAGERASSSGNNGRQGQLLLQQGGQQGQLRSRSGSVASARRSNSGIGSPPLGVLPPVPPMPLHIRPVGRDGCGGGPGFGTQNMVPVRPLLGEVGRTLTARHG